MYFLLALSADQLFGYDIMWFSRDALLCVICVTIEADTVESDDVSERETVHREQKGTEAAPLCDPATAVKFVISRSSQTNIQPSGCVF